MREAISTQLDAIRRNQTQSVVRATDRRHRSDPIFPQPTPDEGGNQHAITIAASPPTRSFHSPHSSFSCSLRSVTDEPSITFVSAWMAVEGGKQWPSEVNRGHQRPSEVIRGHQRPSEAIRGHRRSSEVISPPAGDQTRSACLCLGEQSHRLVPERSSVRRGRWASSAVMTCGAISRNQAKSDAVKHSQAQSDAIHESNPSPSCDHLSTAHT